MSTVCWEYALFLQVQQGVLKSEGARAVPYTVDRADLTQLRDRHRSAIPACDLPCIRRGVGASVSSKDFRPYSKIASEPMGVGALQSKHRFRLRSGRNQKRFLAVLTFFGRPAAPFRALARVEAALARRSDHPGFARRLWSVRAVKTINGSRWRVL